MKITEINKVCREIADDFQKERNTIEAEEILRNLDNEHFGCPLDYNSDNWFWEV